MATTMATTNVKWKDDPLRATLKEDLASGRIPHNMKPAQAQKTRPEYEMMGRSFASRLRSLKESMLHEATKMQGKARQKEAPWDKNNPIRLQMHQDIASGLLPATMDAMTAWNLRPEYKSINDINLFKSRLVGMQKIVQQKIASALQDARDLEHDRQIHPRAACNARGEVQWVDSIAKQLLELDITNRKHEEMTPKELHASRQQYLDDCPMLDVFRGHIHQQVRTNKWRKQWVDGKKEYALVEPN
jgi:hypothetical protein